MVGSKYDLELSRLTEAATNLQNFYNMKLSGFLLASDSNIKREDVKSARQKKRKISLSKYQGTQKLSEEMPPHIKEGLKGESRSSFRQMLAVHKIIDEAMLEMYQNDSFPESSTGDEDLGEMEDVTEARYNPKVDIVYFTTKSGEKKSLKAGKIVRVIDAMPKPFMPSEPEIKGTLSPYVAELIRANENW